MNRKQVDAWGSEAREFIAKTFGKDSVFVLIIEPRNVDGGLENGTFSFSKATYKDRVFLLEQDRLNITYNRLRDIEKYNAESDSDKEK